MKGKYRKKRQHREKLQQELPLNRNPLNQLAKNALANLGVPAEQDYLYSLQLVILALQQKLPDPLSRFRHELLSVANQMLSWPAEEAQRELVNADPSDSAELAAQSLAAKLSDRSPEDQAVILALNLYLNLQERMPSLQVPERA